MGIAKVTHKIHFKNCLILIFCLSAQQKRPLQILQNLQHAGRELYKLPKDAMRDDPPLFLDIGDRPPDRGVPVPDIRHDLIGEDLQIIELLVIHVFSIAKELHHLADLFLLVLNRKSAN